MKKLTKKEMKEVRGGGWGCVVSCAAGAIKDNRLSVYLKYQSAIDCMIDNGCFF